MKTFNKEDKFDDYDIYQALKTHQTIRFNLPVLQRARLIEIAENVNFKFGSGIVTYGIGHPTTCTIRVEEK